MQVPLDYEAPDAWVPGCLMPGVGACLEWVEQVLQVQGFEP